MSESNKRRKGPSTVGTHHGWVFTAFNDDRHLLKQWMEDQVLAGLLNIAVLGDELTADGLPHGQGFANFSEGRGIAFGKLKKLLVEAGLGDVHVEPRKSKSLARAGNYCLKDHFRHIAELFPEKGTVEELFREGSTPLLAIGWDIEGARPERTTDERRRTDLDDFKADVLGGKCTEYDTAMINHSGLCARAEGFVRKFISRFTPLPPMSPAEWNELLTDGRVVRWQAWAMCFLANPDKDFRYRKVGVVTDGVRNSSGGNAGKSHFASWFPRLMANVGIVVQVIGPGKLADMAMQIRSDVDIVIIDIPASRSEALQWSFVEQLKCGRIDSPKYHSTSVYLKKQPVRVLILCNHHPDVTRRWDFDPEELDSKTGRVRVHPYTLSKDRWEEYHITSDHDIQGVPDFMLPADYKFGSEFSSDITGDGPIYLSHPMLGVIFDEHWADSARRWSVGTSDLLAFGPKFMNNGPDSMWVAVKNAKHPLSEPLRTFFVGEGWNEDGTLEVCVRLPRWPDQWPAGKFKCHCLVKGDTWVNDPDGLVVYGGQGRWAKVWFDEYGVFLNLVAQDRGNLDISWHEMICSYAITRGDHILWRRVGEVGFLRPNSYNQW